MRGDRRTVSKTRNSRVSEAAVITSSRAKSKNTKIASVLNMSSWENNEEIQIFREYLRIPSVHPDIDYEPCIEFLANQARSLGLSYKIHLANGDKNKPVLVMTWLGAEPELPSILLNSHMDVVPVYAEHWTHPPFAAEMDGEGRIFGRGSQDMKCVGTQYLAAIRVLKKAGVTLRRTVNLTFVPDEEIGGLTGMASFVKSDDFRALNVGFALDEGMAEPGNTFAVFFAERTIWQINFRITGTAGHGSLLLKNTAGEKFNYVMGKLMDYRVGEERRLEQDKSLHIGDVSSINLTVIRGGVQGNVVPPTIEACFDMRLAIDVDLEAFQKKITQWCKEAGGEIELEWLTKLDAAPPTRINDDNMYWAAFKKSASSLNITVEPHVFGGGTDSQFLREVNIPAIGFSPINNTPILLHDHDEFLKAETYLRGIEIYTRIIEELANVQ